MPNPEAFVSLALGFFFYFDGVRNGTFSVGGEASFDTALGNFLKYDAGLSFSKPNFISSLTLTSKGDTLKASYVDTVSPLTKTVVGAEILQNFSRSKNMFTIRIQHALDSLTTVKGHLNNYGKAAALL
jgi:voltage-dependent anion channel protein 2